MRYAIASLALLLAACGEPEVIHSAPPPEWTEPVEEPAVPVEATDDAVSAYIIALHDALKEANNRLLRLKDWREELETNP